MTLLDSNEHPTEDWKCVWYTRSGR